MDAKSSQNKIIIQNEVLILPYSWRNLFCTHVVFISKIESKQIKIQILTMYRTDGFRKFQIHKGILGAHFTAFEGKKKKRRPKKLYYFSRQIITKSDTTAEKKKW